MINLATLLGKENVQRLIDSARNTHVVVKKDNKSFDLVKKNNDVNYSKVVAIGTRRNCKLLVDYLNL